CVTHSDCPLGAKGTTPAQVGERLSAFFRELDAHPVPAGDSDGRKLGEALATTGVIAAMYDESSWPQLREALTSAMRRDDGAGLLPLPNTSSGGAGGAHNPTLMFATAAVNCLALPPAFSSPEQVEKDLPAFDKASPVFGGGLAWASLNCTYWPVMA